MDIAMGTSPENSLMNFDLDLLLGPASASLSVNPGHDNLAQDVGVNGFKGHGYQTHTAGINGSTECGNTANVENIVFTGYQYEVQNVDKNKSTNPFPSFHTTNHKNKSQDMGNLRTKKQNLEDKSVRNPENMGYGHLVQNELIDSGQDNNDVVRTSDYIALLADHEALRKQYAKLASDYGRMSKENKKNALSSLNYSTKLENVERGSADLLIRIQTQEQLIERMTVDRSATSKQLIQYHGRVEELETQIADLKNSMVKSKYDGKEKRTHISTIKTLTDQLCILGCVLAGKKQLSKESDRFLKKHCKNWTKHSKNNVESEIIEVQSIDTGRGSSLAFSDGERSFSNSPAYSFPFSPFSAGITTPRNEQTKMRDSCTSPPPMVKTLDISTSPISFDQVVTSTPSINTFDAVTNTEISYDANTVLKTTTMETVTSPILFADTITPEAKRKTLNIATSPIEFADTTKLETVDIAVSPVMFADTTTKIITMNIATSPIKFASSMAPVNNIKTLATAVSPIMFADRRTTITETETLSIATSPIQFADTITPVAKTKTLDVCVSPIIFADTITTITETETLSIATSPIQFADTITPVAKTKTLDVCVSPIIFADTITTITETETLSIATSPIQFADTITPVATTKTLDVCVSPIMFADTKIMVSQTETMNNVTSPIQFADTITPVAKTNTFDINVMPIIFADTVIDSPIVYAVDSIPAANPTMRVNVISPVAATKTFNLTNRVKQVEATVPMPMKMIDSPRPIECASAKSSVHKSKSLQVANIPSRKFLKPIAFVPSSCSTDQILNCKEKLNEIIYKQSNRSQDDLENDLEISMILSKFRLDWDMLSPVSVTPEVDQDHEHIPTESKEENKQSCPTRKRDNSDTTLAQSLFLSEDEDSDNEFDGEDCHISDVENPGHVARNNVFDHMKNTESKEVNKQNCPTKKRGICNNNSDITLAQSLFRSEDEDSDNEFDGEDCHISDVENPEHVARNNVFDHMKNTISNAATDGIKQNNTISLVENLVSESLNNEISNKDHAKPNKTHKSTSKYQKLANLQKAIKAYIPKNNITNQYIHKLKPRSKFEECQESVKTSYTERDLPNENLKETQLNKRLQPLTNVKPTETLCKSTETQLKNIIDTPHLPTNSTAETNERKERRCFVTEARSDSTNGISHPPTKSPNKNITKERVCISSISKSELTEVQLNRPSQCSQSLDLPTELVNYSYPNPVLKRISRVRKDTTISPYVPTNQIERERERCNTNTTSPPPKRTADDLVIRNKCDVKQKRTPRISQQNKTKEQANKGPSEITNNPVSYNTNESEVNKQAKTIGQDVSTVDPIIVAKSLNSRITHIDYSDIDMFDTPDDCTSMEASEIKNNHVNHNVNESEGYKQNETSCVQKTTPNQDNSNTILAKDPNCRKRHAGYSDVNMFDTQNVCKSIETEIKNNPASEKIIDSEGYQQNATSITQEDTPSQGDPNIDSIILTQSMKRRKMHVDYNDMDVFDTQNVCKSTETSGITNNSVCNNKNGSEGYQQNAICKQDGTPNQDDSNIDTAILSKSSNDLTLKKNNEILWKDSILDRMIYKYASKPEGQMVPKGDDEIATKIIAGIAKCVNSMPKKNDYLKSVEQLVHELKPYEKQAIVFGLMTYLKDPVRLSEFITANEGKKGFYGKPSKTEIALIDVFQTLKECGTDIWDPVMDMSEFILFRLEHGASPCFSVVESVGHLYANICKYRNDPSRLWLFMLNSMYCFSFKAIPLIKHCLDVAPELIPHSSTRMDIGRASMVRCFVFLLNYYVCEDRRKRIDEIRRRLKYHYKYNLQEENETTLLFFLKEAIIQLNDVKIDKLIMEILILIVAKRRGTKWSHQNIVLKILLPMLDNNMEVSCTAKRFCITTIGCILKPYNNDMLVNTEVVVNKLIDLFEQPSQPDMIKDDIVRSLISMDIKTLWERTNACLSNWNPPEVSPELENALKIYVNRKKLRDWKEHYSKNYEKSGICQ